MTQNSLQKLELKEHVRELKIRLLLSLVAFLFLTSISYYHCEYIYNILTKPLLDINSTSSNRKLIFTDLTEAFFMYMRIAIYSGLFLSFPFIAFQLYYFLAPGLYEREKKFTILTLIFAPILFILGALLAYFYVMPLAWRFFLSFEQHGSIPIILEAKISEYLDLSLSMILGFGLAFQLPIIIALLSKIGIVNPSFLRSKRKYAIVAIFIIAALLTPPDVISQVMLAIPLLLLYEISILLCKIVKKQHV